MKEYINRLSVGKFKMDTPDIIKPDETVVAHTVKNNCIFRLVMS